MSKRDSTGRLVSRRQILKMAGAAASGAVLAGTALPTMPPMQQAMAATKKAKFPKPRYIDTNGIRMAVFEKGRGYPVVFSHGFPELAYSWRYQIDALAKAGFHAIAPDQRGYGLTECPAAIDQYTIHHLTDDLAGMLDALEIDKAVFCGHDWGGFVVFQMALLRPDRVAGVIGVNTPYFPRFPMAPLKMMRQMRGENNYIVAFQEPGVADAVLGEDVDRTFRAFMRKGGVTAEEFAKLPADAPERNFELLSFIQRTDLPGELLMSEKDLRYYVKAFERTTFTGGINWYRNLDSNWETTEGIASKLDLPCLYVGAEDDVVLPPSSAAGMGQWIADLEKTTIMDCGHWTQQEKPEELNAILIDWLTRRFKNAY